MNQMVALADVEGAGMIDYSEFIAAMIDCNRYCRWDVLFSVSDRCIVQTLRS